MLFRWILFLYKLLNLLLNCLTINTIYHCRNLELIKEKYEYLNFQAKKKLSKILFVRSLNRDTNVFVSSQTLYFWYPFFNYIILLITFKNEEIAR